MFEFQEKFIFEAEKLPDDFIFQNKNSFEEINYYPDKSTRINALLFRAVNSKGVVFYNHGNAGNLEKWMEIADDFLRLNYDLLLYDYRGYGKSKGKLSEKALHDDAIYIYNELKKDYPENNIIVYGRSLGTGIAAHTASVTSPKQLILETPYYSLIHLIRKMHRWLPKSIIKYHFRTDLYLRSVKCPLLIFHGTDDEIVDYEDGLKLKELFKPGDEFVTIEGGRHSGLRHYDLYGKYLEAALR